MRVQVKLQGFINQKSGLDTEVYSYNPSTQGKAEESRVQNQTVTQQDPVSENKSPADPELQDLHDTGQ